MANAPSFKALRSASRRASAAARGASKKRDTRCELLLRRALTKLGIRGYRVAAELPGRPDIVFSRARVAVFADGDYWHGRNLTERLARLAGGHNAPYWTKKITSNVERDRRVTAALEQDGWLVLRYWEGEIKRDADAIASQIAARVRERRARLR